MTSLLRRTGFLATLAAVIAAAASPCAADIVRLSGSDFSGGGGSLFNYHYQGEPNVNAVYAKQTDAMSQLTATFTLTDLPPGQMVLLLRASDDDRGGDSLVSVRLNGKPIFEGRNGFPDHAFAEKRFPIPDGLLRAGDNELVIESGEIHGDAGVSPWFMVASATITWSAALPLPSGFHVTVPAEQRPFPEPAAPGAPQFKWRGTKGWAWTMQQYLEEIPHLKRANMNFLMNCYLSMFNAETAGDRPWDGTRRNSWWMPLDPERKQRLEEIVRACKANGIEFCFAMHPQIFSDRPMDLESEEDFEAFFAHFAWMQSLGVKWFSVSMDDVDEAHAGSTHAKFCNKFLKRLRERDPEAQLIFCPTVYHNTAIKGNESYLPALAKEMNKDIYVFWTGADVVPVTMTREDAEHFRDIVKHKLFIWENYPVNDSAPTLHLGPITGRDPDLCKVAEGYMANPLSPQATASRIPLYTMGDFASNPYGYDPTRSIGQAILRLGKTPQEQQALADIVATYLGNFAYDATGTNFNSARHEYDRLTKSPQGHRLGMLYIEALSELLERARPILSVEYGGLIEQLERDVNALRASHRATYTTTQSVVPAP